MAGNDQSREIELTWSGVEALPLQFVNQFVAQLGAPAGLNGVPDGISLVFGCASQPLIVGSPESIQRQVEALTFVAVQPVVRLVMSRERAEELLQVLAKSVGQYDEIVEEVRRART